MIKASDGRRRLLLGLVTSLLTAAALLCVAAWPHLIQSSASVPSASGQSSFSGLVKAVQTIDNDALIVDGVITPLACTIGAIGIAIGNRRGTTIIASSLGVLAFIASIQGIVA